MPSEMGEKGDGILRLTEGTVAPSDRPLLTVPKTLLGNEKGKCNM